MILPSQKAEVGWIVPPGWSSRTQWSWALIYLAEYIAWPSSSGNHSTCPSTVSEAVADVVRSDHKLHEIPPSFGWSSWGSLSKSKMHLLKNNTFSAKLLLVPLNIGPASIKRQISSHDCCGSQVAARFWRGFSKATPPVRRNFSSFFWILLLALLKWN